ncbi:leucyl aminopeptidase [Candidatus Woesearchaeota archaeon]|nr:leucyl aminopeptidase [Candidatus Woesearchaeota archaeon]
MKINVLKSRVEDVSCGVLIVGLFADHDIDSPLRALDDSLGKGLTHLLKSKEFVPDWGKTWVHNTLGKHAVKNILLIGLGKREEFDVEKLRRASGIGIKCAREIASTVVSTLTLLDVPKTLMYDRAHAVAEGSVLGAYRFDQYKTMGKDKRKDITTLSLIADTQPNADKANEALRHALTVSEMVNFARDLINQPPSIMTPTQMSVMAKRVSSERKVKCSTYGRDDILRMGLGGLFAVSKGSTQEPKFIVMEYRNPKAKRTVALVGKGITFDSGGLDIKTEGHMQDMKDDMSGAAVVMATTAAAAQLKIQVNVIGVMPCTENMPGGSAYKDGDIIKTYSKKTIEVLNTDAEGRIILSDALSFAEKNYKPDAIIDLATLTGACVVALGRWSAGLIATNDQLADRLILAASHTGERIWRLPLYDEHKEVVKSQIADVKNIGPPREAGVLTAAAFLAHFVEKTPWAHLDIAGPAFIKEAQDYIPAGGAGFGVRLLVHMLEDWAKE